MSKLNEDQQKQFNEIMETLHKYNTEGNLSQYDLERYGKCLTELGSDYNNPRVVVIDDTLKGMIERVTEETKESILEWVDLKVEELQKAQKEEIETKQKEIEIKTEILNELYKHAKDIELIYQAKEDIETLKEELETAQKLDLSGLDLEDWYQGRDEIYGCDRMHEIADSECPVYNSELDDLNYLYGSEFADALDNAGLDLPEGHYDRIKWGIVEYLEGKCFEVRDEADEIFKNLDEDSTIEDLKASINDISVN